MNRFVIITFTGAWNYGAFYQSLGLKQELEKYGEVVFLQHRNPKILSDYRVVRRPKFGLRGALKLIADLCTWKPRTELGRVFSQCWESLKYIDEERITTSDILVSGSDQIWNPRLADINGRINPLYFWKNYPNLKISYASSSGSYSFTQQELGVLSAHLKSYSFIGLREPHLNEIIPNLKASVVCDPSLFLSNEEQLSSSLGLSDLSEKNDFILVYTVPRSAILRQLVKKALSLHMPIILIDRAAFPLVRGRNVSLMRSVHPFHLLLLFKKANLVLTDSFHGTCMSLKNDVPFFVCNPGANQNRITNLLNRTNSADRYVQCLGEINTVDFSEKRNPESKRLFEDFIRESATTLQQEIDLLYK